MVKIIISCLFFFIVNATHAQITMAEKSEWIPIGILSTLGSTKASLEYRLSGADTIYFMFMKDFTERGKNAEPHYFSIKFMGTDNTFGKLYGLLKSFFLDGNRKDKDYTKAFRLGDEMVYLRHDLLITGKAVRLSTKEGYINLSEKDIDKLFGQR